MSLKKKNLRAEEVKGKFYSKNNLQWLIVDCLYLQLDSPPGSEGLHFSYENLIVVSNRAYDNLYRSSIKIKKKS
jgi:hypothetical protein